MQFTRAYDHSKMNQTTAHVQLTETTSQFVNIQLRITKGKGLAASADCYAKMKYQGHKYKTKDAPLVESAPANSKSVAQQECSWDGNFIVPLRAAADVGNLLVGVYERRVSGSTLVGQGFLRDAADRSGEMWLQLVNLDGKDVGMIALTHQVIDEDEYTRWQIRAAELAAESVPPKGMVCLKLQLFKGRNLSAPAAECYAKVKFMGNKYKTRDAESTAIVLTQKHDVMGHEWIWDQNIIIPLMATDKESDRLLFLPRKHPEQFDIRDNICITVFERNSMSTNTALGNTVVGQADVNCADCAKEGSTWLHLNEGDISSPISSSMFHGSHMDKPHHSSSEFGEVQIWHELMFVADASHATDVLQGGDVDVSWMEGGDAHSVSSPRSKLQYSPKHHWGQLVVDVDREVSADNASDPSPRHAPALRMDL